MNNSQNNLPKSPLALYVKLFRKKRGASKTKDNNVLTEATRSWISLSKSDKQQFLKKYEEYQNNLKIAFADYLKKAEPYLKIKKKTKVKVESNIIEENVTIHDKSNEKMDLDTGQHQEDRPNLRIDKEGTHSELLNVSSTDSTPFSRTHNDLHSLSDIQSVEDPNNSPQLQDYEIQLAEPTPPKLITGEQLFRMINENEDNNLTWTKLTITEKRRYQSAVLSIKKKYIIEYKNYLEQLSPEKLFHHYRNRI